MRHTRKSYGDDTVKLKRPPPKVFTNELGMTVWMSGVAPCKLEIDDGTSKSTDPYNHGLAFTRLS